VIDFLVPVPLMVGLLLAFLFGLFLLKGTKYRKTGITLVVISLGFVLYTFLGFLLSWLTISVLDAHPGGDAFIS